MPGYSCFLREGDEIFHTYSVYGRGTEYTPAGFTNYPTLVPWYTLVWHSQYPRGVLTPLQAYHVIPLQACAV